MFGFLLLLLCVLFFVFTVPSDQTTVFFKKYKKLLLFDARRSGSNGREMDRDEIIMSLNTLLIWNKEQISLESHVLANDNECEWKSKKVKDLVQSNFCCC